MEIWQWRRKYYMDCSLTSVIWIPDLKHLGIQNQVAWTFGVHVSALNNLPPPPPGSHSVEDKKGKEGEAK
jgi:hypothetical protein